MGEIAAARALVDAGRAGEAIAALRAAEAALGDTADLRLEQARAFLALAEASLARADDAFLVKGMVADAQLRWKQALALDADVPGAAVVRAQVLRFEENPAAARAALRAQVAAEPGDIEAHTLLAEMATAARDWQAADDHWTKVAVLDPANGRARLRATIAKQWLGAPAERVEAGYVEAARLLPRDPEPVALLVKACAKDRDRRLAALRRVVAANAGDIYARIWIAYELRNGTPPDVPGALAVLGDAAKAAPDDPAVRFNLAEAHLAAGATLDALRSYVECVERGAPGEWAKASDAIDQMLHDPRSVVAKGVPLELRVRACDAVVAKNPTDGRYGNNAGLWFRDAGRDYERSLVYYLASCAAAPGDQDYLNDTGLIYLFHLADRKEECRKYFDRVVALVEEDGEQPVRGYWDTLENLCRYWFERGEWARVVECAKRRADPKASLDGRPYPSAVAARYGAAATKKLGETRK